MTAFANNLNGIASGTTVTTANSGGVSGTAFSAVAVSGTGATVTAQSTSAFEGATGLQIVLPAGTSAFGQVSWTTSVTAGGRLSASFWYKRAALPSATDPIFSHGGGAQGGSAALDTAGHFLARNAASVTLATSATAMTAGSWYFVQFAVTQAATSTTGRVEMNVYTDAGVPVLTYDSGATTNVGSGTITSVIVGRASGVVAATSSYDLLAADTALTSGFPGTAPAPSYAAGQFLPFF